MSKQLLAKIFILSILLCIAVGMSVSSDAAQVTVLPNGKTSKTTDCIIYGLKGCVRCISTYKLNNEKLVLELKEFYDLLGNYTSKRYYNKNGQFSSRYEYTYNLKGMLSCSKEYDRNGCQTRSTTYHYNSRGDKTSEVFQLADLPPITTTYKYDHGKLIQEKVNDRISETIKYDNYGRFLKRSRPDGKAGGSVDHYRYNKSGGWSVTAIHSESKTKKDIVIYTFDSLGRPIKHKNDLIVLEWSYDKSGNCIKQTGVTSYSKWSQSRTYGFDSHGNWIKQTRISTNGKRTTTLRDIKYY